MDGYPLFIPLDPHVLKLVCLSDFHLNWAVAPENKLDYLALFGDALQISAHAVLQALLLEHPRHHKHIVIFKIILLMIIHMVEFFERVALSLLSLIHLLSSTIVVVIYYT